MESFSTREEYLAYLERAGGLPEGFRVGTAALTFLPGERPVASALPMRLTLVLLDKPTRDFAALFTQNLFPGAPVIIGRERMKSAPAGGMRGVIINNKISNVCAPQGVQDAEDVLAALGGELGAAGGEFFPASTGIIGWSLPVAEMKAALPSLVKSLHGGSCADAAQAIMTTDAYPKLHSVSVGEGRLTGFAKGAGMIEPNLATMLVFLMTDIALPRALMQESLGRVAEKTFNCISVDSDQSTSDTVLLFSSGLKPAVPQAEFDAALEEVCLSLARHIVRNGEGTAHVIRARVCGAPDFRLARDFGKAIVNSPLVKTAVYGNDPNVGRIVSSIGDFAGNAGLRFDRDALTIRLGDQTIFRNGAFQLDAEKEKKLSEYFKQAAMVPAEKTFPLHDRYVDITVEMKDGSAEAVVYGSDLSHEYVTENADYRS
ncbi:MAG: bifunctional glutamate N-acetyltransferase/amino-acid acetyltransferase ArgJ [Spirochaetales bacterium]|jgi:glutamate N-acetyltransferase/amino-acid N-acetyltransferase|nr:bifunctional glutamate N-acetyltransferase/amino-acid acetyltransferase ArgJ [Spirochaetales bacterium]